MNEFDEQPRKLVEPPAISETQNAIENCELMIDESIEDALELEAGRPAKHRSSYNGPEYDAGYAQGRKDACRIILLSFGRQHRTSVDARYDR